MKQGAASVSVIIPAYNASRFIAETLDSVLAQTYQSFEVIVIDDGSRDETPDIVAAYAKRDSRIRLFHQPNSGVGAARNHGISLAAGKYVAPIDADDIWYPRKLEAQVDRLEDLGEEWGFAYCWSKSLNERGEAVVPLDHWPVRGNVFRSLAYRNVVGNASVPLFRMAALRDVGSYRTRAEQGGVQGCEDWDLTLRVAAKYLVEETPDYLVGYRQLASTMSSDVIGMAKSYEYVMADLRRGHPELPPRIWRWSAAHFYNYLLASAYAAGNMDASRKFLKVILKADRAMLLSPPLYRIAIVMALRRIAGPNFLRRSLTGTNPEPPAPPGLIWAPARWVEARRWARLKNGAP